MARVKQGRMNDCQQCPQAEARQRRRAERARRQAELAEQARQEAERAKQEKMSKDPTDSQPSNTHSEENEEESDDESSENSKKENEGDSEEENDEESNKSEENNENSVTENEEESEENSENSDKQHEEENDESSEESKEENENSNEAANSRDEEEIAMRKTTPPMNEGITMTNVEEEAALTTEHEMRAPTKVSVIPVKDIESLKLILAEEEHFSCKISIRSRFEDYCKTIKENLNEQELKRFRETQFGHLLDVPNQYQHSSQLLLYFILRQIEVRKDYEMWMMVQGTPMRFSMEEYAMMTGLNFAPVEADEKLEKAKKNTYLQRKYFNESDNVSVADLEKMLKGMEHIEGDDKIKMALLLFLNGVLLGLEPKSRIEKNHMGMVNDILLFDNQDWGLQSYKKTISSLRKNIKAKAKEQQKIKSMAFNGFVHAFQMWIYEMVTVVANKFAYKRDENFLPRMLRWNTKKWNEKDSPTYKDIEQLFSKEDIIRSLLVPTEEEKSLAYISYATVLDDNDDEVIDPLFEKLRSGAVISRHVGRTRDNQFPPSTPSSSFIPPNPANMPSVPPEPTESYNLYEAVKTYFDERLARMEAVIGKVKTHFDDQLAQMKGKIDDIAIIVSNMQQSIDVEMSHRQAVTEDELNRNHNRTPIDAERAHVVNHDIMDDMNDGVDPREFYVTPHTLVVNDNVSLLPPSDVFDEVTSKVNCRPFRRKKRSTLLQSPYTDPRKRTRYHRKSGLQHNPLRETPDGKKASFEEFMSKPYNNIPIQCGLMRHNQIFFKEIMQPGTYLNCEHVDEALFGLRKMQKKYNDIFNQEVAILDNKFITLVKSAYEEKGNKDSYHCNPDLKSYWLGSSPKLGNSWKNMKALYMPLHVSENHWFAVKADLENCKFTVFDTLISKCVEHELEAYMIPLCTMMPIILEQSNMFTKLVSKSRHPWPFIRLTNVPQSKNGDSAIYAIKFIELDSAGASFRVLCDDTIPFFRTKIAMDIFPHD